MEPSNILKIESLDEGWSDKDNVMLHACFQLLTDCIEKEQRHQLTDWNQNTEFQTAMHGGKIRLSSKMMIN